MAKSKTKSDSSSRVATVDPVAMMRDEDSHEEGIHQEGQQEALIFYLSRIGEKKLTPSEASTLAEAARDLGLTADDVENDRRLVELAKRYTHDFDQTGKNHQRVLDARRAYQEFLERIDLEETVLSMRKDRAEQDWRNGRTIAVTHLENLAKSRPELFDFSQHPPRLKASTAK